MAATKTTKRAKKTDSGSQKDQIAKLDPNEKLDISTIDKPQLQLEYPHQLTDFLASQ